MLRVKKLPLTVCATATTTDTNLEVCDSQVQEEEVDQTSDKKKRAQMINSYSIGKQDKKKIDSDINTMKTLVKYKTFCQMTNCLN